MTLKEGVILALTRLAIGLPEEENCKLSFTGRV